MTDKQGSMDDWAEIQRRYWQQLNELQSAFSGKTKPPRNDWEGALDSWWQGIEPSANGLTQHFMEKMMGHGKGIFELAEKLSQPLGSEGVSEIASRFFDELRDGLSSSKGGKQPLSQLMAFWELPFDNWQQAASIISPGQSAFTGDPSNMFNAILNTPGLGLTREEQAQQQEMTRRLIAYQDALQDYSTFYAELGVACADKMETKLEELDAKGETIDSAKALYDLWVAVCEGVYGERVMTADYAALHGRLVNGLMAVKQQFSRIMDSRLTALGLPTNGEVKTLQQRLHENRREIKKLKSELSELKAALAETGSHTSGKPKAKKSAKKKTAV